MLFEVVVKKNRIYLISKIGSTLMNRELKAIMIWMADGFDHVMFLRNKLWRHTVDRKQLENPPNVGRIFF